VGIWYPQFELNKVCQAERESAAAPSTLPEAPPSTPPAPRPEAPARAPQPEA
jgi:hypothetical protein